MRKLFYLLTVLAMLTVTFSGIGCEAGAGNSTADGTSNYDSDPSEGGSYTNDGASGGVDVPMPAGSTTSSETDGTETE